MGAYILITVLAFWFCVAFTFGPTLVEDAVDAYADMDPVFGNLPLMMIYLMACCVLALPRIALDAFLHFINYTPRR